METAIYMLYYNKKTIKIMIKLYNRYGDKNYLDQVDEHIYILRLDPRSEGYCRFGLLEGHEWEDNEYDFVDPAGGPFIQVDSYEINGKPVKRIYKHNDNIIIEV